MKIFPYIIVDIICPWVLETKSKSNKTMNHVYRVSLKKSGISKFLTFCVIAMILLSSKEKYFCFHKIEFIVVILSIIDFLSSKRCPRY